MIQLTVKTLDSVNHPFSVEDETTVAQLKEKIRGTLGFELDNQRLIFCGRVLLDDQTLKEYGVDNGKCLHLVERPPPSPPSRRRGRDRMEGGHAGDHRGRDPNQLYSMRMNPRHELLVQQQMAFISPTAGRLNSIRGVITEIKATMAALRIRAGDLVAVGGYDAFGGSGNDESANMETDSSGEARAQPENADERDDEDEDEETQAQRRRRQRAARSMGPRFPANPRDLGRMLEELDLLHDEFAPFRAEYVAMLRTLTSHTYPEAERQQRQDVVRLICDIMHSFAHCYHSISDITFNVGQRPPRLSSESPAATNNSLPVQAHINVVTATGPHSMSGDRRGAGAGSAAAGATTATTTTGATATATTATGGTATIVTGANASAPLANQAVVPRPDAPPPALPTDLDTISDTFNVRGTSSTNCTPIHTTTSTFRRPLADRSSATGIQVEIETRGLVAIPRDGNSLSDLASVASDVQEARGQHARAIADAEAARAAAAAYRARSNPIQVPPSNRRRQNFPPALIALENLESWGPVGRAALTAPEARSAPTALSELSEPTAPSALTASSAPAHCPFIDPVRGTELGHTQQTERQSDNTNVASAAEPSAPAAPAGQTASGSTFRGSRATSGATTGATSGATGSARPRTGAVPLTPQSPGLAHVHVAGLTRLVDQTRDGARPRVHLDVENFMRNLSGGVGLEVVMSMEEIPNFLSSSGLDGDMNDEASAPWGGPMRRAADTQYPFSMSCFEYDRYLNCDSVHARERLQSRREIYERQANAERERAARAALPDIADIRFGNRRFTSVHMLTMMRLLNDPISEQGHLNAYMLIVARQVFLHPTGSTQTHTTGPVPTEFPGIRIQLRNFIQRNLERSCDMGRHQDRFEAFSERIRARAESFLREFPNIELRGTTSRIVINPAQTFRAYIQLRLPTVIAWIMSQVSSEIIATRFYNVMYTFFADLCTLFMRFLKNDFNALVRRYDVFMASITENYGSSTRNWLRLLSHENIVASRSYIESDTNARNVRQYLRQTTGAKLPPPCCLYQAMLEGGCVVQNPPVLADYCQWHLQQVRPLQAPPLLPPPSSDDDSSKGNTPTTTKSRDRQCEHADQKDETGSDNQASGPDAGPRQRSEGSSAAGSPSHSRSEPQAEAEPEEESAGEASAAETVPSEPSPRRVRRFGFQSPNDSQSLASDLTSESHPPGIMAITITDADSLCDVEELDEEALVDDIDPYVCEYITERRPVVYSPLNIIEDEADDEVNEDDEVDIETIDDDSSLVAEDLEIRVRREKRERSIRRDVARRRLEGNIRHKRTITLSETAKRIDLRHERISGWNMAYDEHLHKALDRVVEERRKLEEGGEQARGTDDEISEEKDESTTLRSDEDLEHPELAQIQQQIALMNDAFEMLSYFPSLPSPLVEEVAIQYSRGESETLDRLISLVRQATRRERETSDRLISLERQANIRENEPDDDFLDPQPGPSGINTRVEVDEFGLYLNVSNFNMIPLQMNQLNNDFESDDENSSEYLSPIHRPAQGADDDWYSPPPFRYPYLERDDDGYYSPQLSMYHEGRPGFLTPQPIKVNAPAARPAAATTNLVSDESEEYDDEDDDFNRRVSQLRIESSEPTREQDAPQTLQPTTKDQTQQATEIAENVAQTDNAEKGQKDIPHTSADLDLATQAPMEGIVEDEELRSIMGSSWEPVLREDGAVQARGGCPQPPFSDAYLSGMPACKRRCLRESRPVATLDALMNDGLRGVSEGIPGGLRGSHAELNQLLRDSVRGFVAARARDQPEDYDPSRFPNTAAFLASADRSKTKEPEEKTPTPPKNDVTDSVE